MNQAIESTPSHRVPPVSDKGKSTSVPSTQAGFISTPTPQITPPRGNNPYYPSNPQNSAYPPHTGSPSPLLSNPHRPTLNKNHASTSNGVPSVPPQYPLNVPPYNPTEPPPPQDHPSQLP
ncbi:hypothetical protein Drorol1_Dr00017754, partial [Drosera rotundifolia]